MVGNAATSLPADEPARKPPVSRHSAGAITATPYASRNGVGRSGRDGAVQRAKQRLRARIEIVVVTQLIHGVREADAVLRPGTVA